MSSNIKLAWLDDWEGLYIDGELVLEGHRLQVRDVIEKITGNAPESVDVTGTGFHRSAWHGGLPEKYDRELLDEKWSAE